MGLSLHDRLGQRQAGAPEATTRVDRAHTLDVGLRRPRRRGSGLLTRLAALDVAALVVGWSAGWIVAATTTSGPASPASVQVDDIAVGVVVSFACFAAFGLYRAHSHGSRSTAPGAAARAIGVAAVAVTGWQAVVGDAAPGLAVGAAGGALLAVIAARYAFDVWLIGCRRQGRHLTPVVVAGTATDTAAMIDFLALNPEAGFRAAATLGGRRDDEDEARDVSVRGPEGAGRAPAVPWLGGYGQAVEAVRRTDATGVLVAVNHIPTKALHTLLRDVSAIGLPVHLSSGLTGFAHSRLRAMPVAHEPFVVLQPQRHSTSQRALKRAIDLMIASAALIVTAPALAVCAAAIKINDGGPVLFRQLRVGRDGSTFRCLKLRTMAVDAEDRLADVADLNERTGPLFKLEDDPRITRVGAFMRSSALDELPQLINVLRGEMSIVGPRPATPREAREFDAGLQRRHVVRPGMTGLWQTEANHKAAFEEYRRLDLFYVTNWSVALDLAILVNTVPTITRRALAALSRSAPSAPVPTKASPPASPSGTDRLATGPLPLLESSAAARCGVPPVVARMRAGGDVSRMQ